MLRAELEFCFQNADQDAWQREELKQNEQIQHRWSLLRNLCLFPQSSTAIAEADGCSAEEQSRNRLPLISKRLKQAKAGT